MRLWDAACAGQLIGSLSNFGDCGELGIEGQGEGECVPGGKPCICNPCRVVGCSNEDSVKGTFGVVESRLDGREKPGLVSDAALVQLPMGCYSSRELPLEQRKHLARACCQRCQ
jgi:hypothetical protein